MKKQIGLFFLMICFLPLQAQEVYDLERILDQVIAQSWSSRNATYDYEQSKISYALFESSLKPTLDLNGQIPGFYRSTSAITQPNGSINFNQISQNNSNLSLVAMQPIAATGGRLFLQSDIGRFDDFGLNYRAYNGVPIRFGIVQPLGQPNFLKWSKKIEPIRIQEAEKSYQVQLEISQIDAIRLYFDVLAAREEFGLAKSNVDINQKLLTISKERLNLGKISRDEKIQIEMELATAKLNFNRSQLALESAKKSLWVFLGMSPKASNASFQIALPMADILIDEDQAVQFAMSNRPEIVAFQRQLLESERDLDVAKKENGPQANLVASVGYARGSELLQEIYQDAFAEQQLSLSFQVPLVDWGTRKSAVELAKNQLKQVEDLQVQTLLDLENQVRIRVQAFLFYQQSVRDQENLKLLAEKRFEIANESYTLGVMTVTDWSLAQREKDRSNSLYIQALYEYWNALYELRMLTGYDFFLNQKITY